MSRHHKIKNRGARFIITLIIVLLLVSVGGIWFLNQKNLVANFIPQDYSASNEQLNNPYCGWYHTYPYEIRDDVEYDLVAVSTLLKEDNNTRLCQLSFDLSAYHTGGITPEGIRRIEDVLGVWKYADKEILVNFFYEEEPADIATVYLHMEQLSDVVNQNSDSIYAINGCLVDVAKLEKQQAEELREYERSLIDESVLVLDRVSLEGVKDISDLRKMQLFCLNADDNSPLIEQWKNETYRGEDVFSGVTMYDYIASHLGYRYRITAAEVLFDTWDEKKGEIKLHITNEGFAVANEQFDTTILLKNKDTEEIISIPFDDDNRDWKPSEDVVIKKELDIRSLEKGTYNVYMLMRDTKSGEVIRMGNTMPLTANGYQIGMLQLQ